MAPDSDALFDSSRVAHSSRWALALPGIDALREALAAGLEQTLQLLDQSPASSGTDDGLYFHRLVLAHEDMHHEAALYMAQALGLPQDTPRWLPQPLRRPRQS